MSHLAELQYWMADILRRRRSLSKSAEITAEATKRLTGNDRLRPVEQADIYREQFWLRHTSALVEDFPGLGGIVGQSEWERLVEEYLTDFPPESFTLRDLPDRMPEHVERCTWLDHHDLCVDMARLEWKYVEVFDAADAAPLDTAKIAAIPEDAWSRARIRLHPSVRLLAVRYPVAELRRKLRGPNHEHLAIPDPEPQNLVLYRGRTRNLEYDVVGAGAFALLRALDDGLPLVAAAERAVGVARGEAKAIEVSVGEWFQKWGARGWIVDVVV